MLINSNLEWRLLNTVTGNEILYLPEEYNEIIVNVDTTTTEISMTMHFCKKQLTSTLRQYRSGWFFSSVYYAQFVLVINNQIAQLQSFVIEGENVAETSKMSVYIR